ncbi:hypothetical protein HYX18_03470 [Candidatus Woesearchaeota archaeon]|nr:hypothetical protein [Candidatus Woesearchaeota archaeon]
MLTIGRICIKTAGRDKDRVGIVIDLINDKFVLIDGNVRRKRCNISHLEPLPEIVNIDKNAPVEIVKKELSALGYRIVEKTKKIKNQKDPSKESQKKETRKKESKLENKNLDIKND